MNLPVPELIRKKREGGELAAAEIEALVAGFTQGAIPDYQMSALLMAVCFRGMTSRETASLTTALVASGRRVDLSGLGRLAADKHSTGGVGDKTTLVLAPLVAAAGLPVAKLSGRGLGHTGGTLDKLESIPGFRTDLTLEAFAHQVEAIGIAVAGQTPDLVPADGKLYALRDVTATVESLPLIAASVMSKKIAGGAGAVVLDVKAGRGAFMQSPEAARDLAGAMLEIGRAAGLHVAAVVSSMEQPLGRAVGNALEVREAVDVLEGRGSADVAELCLTLGTELLLLAGLAADPAVARQTLQQALSGGAARRKLDEWVAAQGGDPAALTSPGGLPTAPLIEPWAAPRSGYVTSIDALVVGQAAVSLGAGRRVKGQAIDPSTGFVLAGKVGDRVSAGEPLAWVHARDPLDLAGARARLAEAYQLGPEPPGPSPLLYGVLRP